MEGGRLTGDHGSRMSNKNNRAYNTADISEDFTNYRSHQTQQNGNSRNKNRQSLIVSSPGIKVPLDLSIEKMAKSKNESIFTTSLLQGDSIGYAIGHGVQNSINNYKTAKRNRN